MSAFERKPSQTRRVMTGSTGFLGSHFALRCCRAGNAPIALARAASELAAGERVAEAVRAAARSLAVEGQEGAALPLALPADLSQPGCAVGAEALARLQRAQPEQFWHFAASLRYEDKHRSEIFSSNLEGTKRALGLAKALGCTSFVQVSTAYTAGRQRGVIQERLHDSAAGFNNAYEESKARAEHLVAEFCTREGLRFSILRPSIVVGPYSTKSTGGSTTGLYGFVREVGRIARALQALGRPIEFCGDPSTLCNLIPVDWFMDDVFALLEEGLSDATVYHNTCEHPLTIAQVGKTVASALNVPGFVVDEHAILRSPLEERLARRTAFYGSYFSNSKAFLRRRASTRELTEADIMDYVRASLREFATPSPVSTDNVSRARV